MNHNRKNEKTIRPNAFPGRVLVVDNDPIARMILSRWMEIWDLRGSFFGEAAPAFTDTQHTAFSLAIIEYQLPDMTGLELIQLIRTASQSKHFTCPFFALHTTDSEVRHRARDEGVEFFLQKPLSCTDLLLTVKESGCNPKVSDGDMTDFNRVTQQRVNLHPPHSHDHRMTPIR